MKDKTLLWIVLYLVGVILVIFLVRFGVTWYFGNEIEDYSDRKASGVPQEPLKAEGFAKYLVHRRDYSSHSIYTIRGLTTGEIVEKGDKLYGNFYLKIDPQKRSIPFIIKGKSRLYVLGSHWPGFSEYPKNAEEVAFQRISARIPKGTFVQLRISSQDFPDEDKIRMIDAIEAVAKNEWKFEGLTIPAFGIEVID
ncbi:hypothetical protein ACFL1A_00785 [Patescibacteria group bacterium]